jgi:thymidylate synthase (FAD)
MKAELIDRMGDDIRVANAARVSFNKESEWEDQTGFDEDGYFLENSLSKKDQKLLSYLAKHNHWTPFSHVMITMRETVPIFIARQRFKHMVGFTYNEVSRRYVDDTPDFFFPDTWRGKPVNAKQGSSDQVVEEVFFRDYAEGYNENVGFAYSAYIEGCKMFYESLIAGGVAPEQARMILPQSMYTSYYVTGSLAAWARAYKLRIDPHAQKEIQDLATQWGNIIGDIPELKYSWKALTEHRALQYRKVHGMPSGNVLGMRVDGKYYSAKWNKNSVIIRGN